MNKTRIFNKVVRFLQTNRHYSSEVYTKIDFKNGIRKITLDHPKTRNSLSIAMMESLIKDINHDRDDPSLRIIVITGEGPIFSAGHNLKELAPECGRAQHQKVFDLATILMNSIIDSPVPIIARVDGLAAAAGCQLVAQCDMAVCSDISTFSTPGAAFGVFCSTPGIALARCVPKMTSMKMLLTGKPIDSAEAKASGLVTSVCSKDKLDEEIFKLSESIMSKSRAIIELGKRFYYKQIQQDIRKAYNMAGEVMLENVNSLDGVEGIKSFMEKRKPKWNH